MAIAFAFASIRRLGTVRSWRGTVLDLALLSKSRNTGSGRLRAFGGTAAAGPMSECIKMTTRNGRASSRWHDNGEEPIMVLMHLSIAPRL